HRVGEKVEFGGELWYHANQAVPRRTGQHRGLFKPRRPSKSAGFSLSYAAVRHLLPAGIADASATCGAGLCRRYQELQRISRKAPKQSACPWLASPLRAARMRRSTEVIIPCVGGCLFCSVCGCCCSGCHCGNGSRRGDADCTNNEGCCGVTGGSKRFGGCRLCVLAWLRHICRFLWRRVAASGCFIFTLVGFPLRTIQ